VQASPIKYLKGPWQMTIHSLPKSATPATRALPAHEASRLTEGGDQAHIVLNDQTYTLRITRAGKLILTK
jgi:hemin uptake protein HemP